MPSLREKQSLFVRLLQTFFEYAHSRGYELTLGEGHVDNPRKTRAGRSVEDGGHMDQSLHYSRLAIDLNLFVDGKYISDGGHEAWQDLGLFWEGLHPMASWGGRFRDANHLSLRHGGRA